MTKNNRWRDIAKEIEIDPAQDPMLGRMLKALVVEADAIGDVPPPPGYEEQLIRALRTKLPLQTVQAQPSTSGFWAHLTSVFTIPQFRLGTVAGFALIALVVGISLQHRHATSNDTIAESMLMKTAKASDVASVDSWLMSVSDSATVNANRNIASLSEEITKGLNQDEQKKVLNNFAGQGTGNI